MFSVITIFQVFEVKQESTVYSEDLMMTILEVLNNLNCKFHEEQGSFSRVFEMFTALQGIQRVPERDVHEKWNDYENMNH